MKGFWIALGMLALTTFGCAASMLSANTGLVLPLVLAFYGLSLTTAYQAGRSVDLQLPIKPRNTDERSYTRNRSVQKSGNGSLLGRVKANRPADEFN